MGLRVLRVRCVAGRAVPRAPEGRIPRPRSLTARPSPVRRRWIIVAQDVVPWWGGSLGVMTQISPPVRLLPSRLIRFRARLPGAPRPESCPAGAVRRRHRRLPAVHRPQSHLAGRESGRGFRQAADDAGEPRLRWTDDRRHPRGGRRRLRPRETRSDRRDRTRPDPVREVGASPVDPSDPRRRARHAVRLRRRADRRAVHELPEPVQFAAPSASRLRCRTAPRRGHRAVPADPADVGGRRTGTVRDRRRPPRRRARTHPAGEGAYGGVVHTASGVRRSHRRDVPRDAALRGGADRAAVRRGDE